MKTAKAKMFFLPNCSLIVEIIIILQILWDNVEDDVIKFINENKSSDEKINFEKKINIAHKACTVLIVTTEW